MNRNGGKHPWKGDTRSCIVRLASSTSLSCHSLSNNMSNKRFQAQTVHGSGTHFALGTKFQFFKTTCARARILVLCLLSSTSEPMELSDYMWGELNAVKLVFSGTWIERNPLVNGKLSQPRWSLCGGDWMQWNLSLVEPELNVILSLTENFHSPDCLYVGELNALKPVFSGTWIERNPLVNWKLSKPDGLYVGGTECSETCL